MSASPETHIWWASLRHGGFLLDEQRLRANFPSTPEHPLSSWAVEQLRGALTDFADEPDDTANRTHLLTVLFENACGLDHTGGGTWNRKPDPTWTHRSVTGEAIRPAHVWDGPGGRRLPVFTTSEKRLGVGHGRRAVARVLEWLRARNEPLAVLSNGHQVRIVWAGADTHAWCESDSALWLVEGAPGPQLDALRLLLSLAALTPVEDKSGRVASPLLRGVLDSRKGQSELSALLGERVRLAVERLIQSHGSFLNTLANPPTPADTYVAACRVVMRLVFSFFAESRELLPRSLPIYHQSYSLAGLLTDLDRAAGSSRGERLAHRFGAWPRLLALFRLIHDGSEHEALPLLAYGGTLFAPGVKESPDGIRRALWVFENACFDAAHPTMPDREVWEILRLLTKTTLRVRQGSGSTMITVPVDFSDLSSEYIGILYEGLLDYELRSVSPAEGAVIFLAVGNEPALPLARLENMDDAALKGLFETFKKAAKAAPTEGEDDDVEEKDSAEAEETLAEETPLEPAEVEEAVVASDLPARETALQRALTWGKKAATQSGLVKKPRAKGGAAALEFERNLDTAARSLVRRLVLPGEWYLLRWGGTRKGAGTFYTRPGLSLPTIRRALEPLAYDRAADGSLIPKPPEVILALKVGDLACGSGTFPVGALRYLAEALFHSVFHHRWLERAEERQADGSFHDVIRPIERRGDVHPLLQRARDEVAFRNALHDEDSLRGFLKRLVVENCLYGVDLDPLAIELARLALWVETMDRRLPFGFLDHKFRCGNGFVGTWLDTFQHYPVMAWLREGGDKYHKNGVHYPKDAITNSLKTHLDDVIRPALRTYIDETTTPVFALLAAFHEPNRLLDEAREAFAGIHASITDPAEQQRAFEEWQASPHYQNLRAALDLWCALWFWPTEKLAAAPTPLTFAQPTSEALAIAEEVRRQLRFFHWELEFPDVFTADRTGFDAMLGNPPWEIQKPNSKEWFSNVDPLYRTYGKTAAVVKQTALFTADRAIEEGWLSYNARLKALSNFTKFAAFAFGDPAAHENKAFRFSLSRSSAENDALHARWRPKRARLTGFADPAHPFHHQGSADINSYKLFTEQALALLRLGGRLGFILHSGIYSDQGSTALRVFMLDKCSWEWCFGFENREAIFDIDSRFKFAALIVEKGGRTAALRAAFMRQHVEDWAQAEAVALLYPRALITKLSPVGQSLVEILDQRAVAILESMYSKGVLLGDQSESGWKVRMHREFHMTDDAKLFPAVSKWEALKYFPDEYGHWVKGPWQPQIDSNEGAVRSGGHLLSQDRRGLIRIEKIEDIAVPLYEGVMTWQFDPCYRCFVVSGSAKLGWQETEDNPRGLNTPRPQSLTRFSNALRPLQDLGSYCLVFRAIQNATNRRTFIASVNPGYPTGNSLSLIEGQPLPDSLVMLVSICSFLVDWILRPRMSQANLNYFILGELPLLSKASLNEATRNLFVRGAAALSLDLPQFSKAWLSLRAQRLVDSSRPMHSQLAVTVHERLRWRCVLDALVAHHFQLSREEFAYVLEKTDLPVAVIADRKSAAKLPSKGFWRVDKEQEPELRHTVLAQVAFADIQAQGLDAFLAGPNGDGWQLPETLRLADYSLGHDDRAREPQPVAARLGPRFLPWQLERDAATSWAECEAHAALLDQLWRHARTLAGTSDSSSEPLTLAETPPAPKRQKPEPPPPPQMQLI